MNETTLTRLAKPMLFAAALIWGSSFFIMKGAVDVIPTFYLLAIRFTGGAVLLSLVCWKSWRQFTPDYLWRGAVIGGFLLAAYGTQTFGLMETTPSKNAFLTSVYCVLVPFLYWAAAKRKPDRYNILAAVLCVAGVGLVSLDGSGFVLTRGDGLTLVSAFFYAAHIVAVAKVSPEKDITLLTIFQFLFGAIYAWALALIFQTAPARGIFTTDLLVQLGYLTVMCTTVALLFQNVGQSRSDPSSAAIILSLESVFGVLFSVIFYHDVVTVPMLAGFVLIFVAVVCSETKLAFLHKVDKKECA